QPRSWIELGLLSEILAERRQAWEALCLRTPGCPGAWQAELLAAEVELRRGQAFLALRRILRSSPPEGGDADTGLREARRRLLADLLQGLGLVSAALRELGPRTPAWAPDHLDAWTSSALAAGAREEALAALLEEHGRRPGSREIGTLVASLLSDEGRVEEAEAIWARLESLYPGDPDLPLERAELLARLGRGEEALGHLDALVARFPCNARVRDRQGIILARLGRVEEAAAAWRAGHSLEPQNPELQARLQRMEPGGRHWRALRRDLSWALAAAAEAPGEQPLEGLADVRLVTIHPDGLLSIHRQQILRVNRPGADAELTLGEVYDPHSEDLTTLLAVVLRGTGEVSLALEGDDVSLSQEEFNLYYDMRQRLRTFPRIEPGDVVLWETRMDQFRGARGGVSLVRPLQEGFPKRRVDVSLLSPPGLDLHAAMLLHTGEPAPEPPPLPTPEGTLVTWRLEDLEGMPARPLPPPLTERSAHLAVSSMTGWRQVAEWYQALLDQQAADAPALRVLADGLSRAASPLEATARFVADDVRYVGLEFGVNAYVPYPSARVLERRYGDCKDKSLLMVTLLRRLGLEAHVALVRTYPFGALRDPPPSISLFDHAIVRIPGPDVWFDPTARYLGTRSLPWQNQGAQVLVLDDDPVLELLPVAPAEENRAALRLLIHGHGGRHQVSATGEFLGAQARANYEVVQDPARWDAEVERFIGGLVPGFRLQEAPWEVREGGVPAFSLEVEGFLEPGGPGELTLFGGQRYLPRLAGLTSRTEDLVLRFPFQEATILEIDALGVRLAGPSMDTGEAPGCRWEVSTAPGRLEVMVELPARRVAAQDYGAFRACLGALDTALARVRLQVPGETP
ncbi:MAG: DUF3857 domain-containing protein, partial [Deltaproteobacteria bacterium]|nr:DUF3857 domain-containing protein [Deltaproteobacteria bacterium]